MKRFISKKTVAIGLAAGLILGASGTALAFWTTTGSGTGSATTKSLNAVTITGTAASNLDLGVANSMNIDIDNTGNTSPVTLNGETVTIVHAYCGTDLVNDRASWFTSGVITQANEVAPATLGSSAASAPLTLKDLAATDQNPCQGKSVALTLSAA